MTKDNEEKWQPTVFMKATMTEEQGNGLDLHWQQQEELKKVISWEVALPFLHRRALVRPSACGARGCWLVFCCTNIKGLQGEGEAKLSALGRLEHEPPSLPVTAEIDACSKSHPYS